MPPPGQAFVHCEPMVCKVSWDGRRHTRRTRTRSNASVVPEEINSMLPRLTDRAPGIIGRTSDEEMSICIDQKWLLEERNMRERIRETKIVLYNFSTVKKGENTNPSSPIDKTTWILVPTQFRGCSPLDTFPHVSQAGTTTSVQDSNERISFHRCN